MTQHRVENTRVHFWTFSPVSVKPGELGHRFQNLLEYPNMIHIMEIKIFLKIVKIAVLIFFAPYEKLRSRFKILAD